MTNGQTRTVENSWELYDRAVEVIPMGPPRPTPKRPGRRYGG